MMKPGLVSITFRELEPEEIIKLVKKAGLKAIEWGGDKHVPHGGLKQAKKVAAMTTRAGLEVAAYGSYYRVGCKQGEIDCTFAEVLETAVALQAPLIRVWAGNKGSKEAGPHWWHKVVKKSREIASLAAEKNIKIAFEYHGGTLTDDNEKALKLLKEIDHPNIYTYWQPPIKQKRKYCLQGLQQILPWLTNVHVYYWDNQKRKPLVKGKTNWNHYFKEIIKTGRDHYVLLEFVKDNNPLQFVRDASALKKILNKI